MAKTAIKLFSTGVLQSRGEIDEVNFAGTIRVTPTNVYASEFDEVSLTPSIGLGLTGNVSVNERGYGIAVDSSGNRYGVGNIGEGSLIKFSLIKNDTTGNVAWQRELTGSELHTQGFKIVTDSSGNVYAVGADQLNSSPYTKWVVVVKFNSSGTIQWQRRLETNNNTISSSIALDNSNNVYIVTSDYGATSNLIAAKYNSSGTIQWQKRFYSTAGAGSEGTGLAVDSAGNVYACGRAFGKAIIVKFNTSGVYQWAYSLGGEYPQSTYAYGMTVDSSDNLYMVGNVYNSTSAQQEMLLFKLNSSGTQQWQRTLGSNSNNTYGYAITVDSSDNVYTTGMTNNVWDIYVAKYNTSGTLQWQRTLGSTAYEIGQSIKISSTGDIQITGGSSASGTEDIFFATLPSDGSRTGTHIIGGYSFDYSESSMTAATGTLSYSSGISGSPFTTSDAGLTESAGVLTVATSTLTVTTNSGGGTIPAERRTSTGKYFVSGYFDEVTIAPGPNGQQAYTTPGTYSWTCPAGVFSVSVVCVGGGGNGTLIYSGGATKIGGGGGGLGWKNNIPVNPGQTYTVVVGDRSGDSYFIDGTTVKGGGGGGYGNGSGGSYVGDGGGMGGNGNAATYFTSSYIGGGGGGGAGGYSGKGGNAGIRRSGGGPSFTYAQNGSGGGGAGGYSNWWGGPFYFGGGNGGGGVGIFGEGTSGTVDTTSNDPQGAGGGGSSGTTGGSTYNGSYVGGAGGSYGGGGGGTHSNNFATDNGYGGTGAVRIIWGDGRAFPSTDTIDL
jgi:hypothetical protein